jgi:hypothetical protein
MNSENIYFMAKQAGFDPHDMSSDFTCNLKDINSFAKLVAQHEREACAKLADEWAVGWPHPSKVIALDIRARGQA